MAKKSKKLASTALVCRADKPALARGKKSTRVIEICLTAPEAAGGQAKPRLNLGVVIDRSGSMTGEKLGFAKQAAAHLIDLLGEDDRAAVVMYDDEVALVSPSREMTAANKTEAKTEIQKIFSRGSTALFDGWLKGCEQVAGQETDGRVNRTLLLSDGLANVGLTDQDQIASHARNLFDRDVSTSCFGIGRDYNEHLLEAMSNAGGGNFHFLEALSAIPLAFEREFEELISVSLKDARIELDLPEGAECEVSGGWPSAKNNGNLSVSLGSLYAGRQVIIYLQVHMPAGKDQDELHLPIAFHASSLDGKTVRLDETMIFQVLKSSDVEKLEADAELMKRFALVDMADRATEALRMARAGDRAGANILLQGSMNRHQKHMPASMTSKYENLSYGISEGMDELSLKRRHQEEYFNKRARFDVRDYRLRAINGHLFTNIENQDVLVDTGIPASLGREDEFYFMQEVHQLSQGYLGVTLDQISRLVGAPVDILLGSDILKRYVLLFELARQRFSISTQPMMRSRHNFPLTLLMGVPSVWADVSGQPCQMYIDTGARLSYISSELISDLTPVGRERDFFPALGEFETDVYDIDFSLGDLVFTLRCGVLPGMLETAMRLSGSAGILGVDLFRQYSIQLDFPRQTISLRA